MVKKTNHTGVPSNQDKTWKKSLTIDLMEAQAKISDSLKLVARVFEDASDLTKRDEAYIRFKVREIITTTRSLTLLALSYEDDVIDELTCRLRGEEEQVSSDNCESGEEVAEND